MNEGESVKQKIKRVLKEKNNPNPNRETKKETSVPATPKKEHGERGALPDGAIGLTPTGVLMYPNEDEDPQAKKAREWREYNATGRDGRPRRPRAA